MTLFGQRNEIIFVCSVYSFGLPLISTIFMVDDSVNAITFDTNSPFLPFSCCSRKLSVEGFEKKITDRYFYYS